MGTAAAAVLRIFRVPVEENKTIKINTKVYVSG
jgi:hypothetical protein